MIETRHSGDWESAVRRYRAAATVDDVRANYFDLPVQQAAERFYASAEFAATRACVRRSAGRLLDIGAGQGVSAYAWARAGWEVTALEPDPSREVGAGAIAGLAAPSVPVVRAIAEAMPFADASFDVVYARQVLHHSRALPALMREVARVLKPGGTLCTVRDHVADDAAQREAFLAAHPLHRDYGGEWAYAVNEYVDAARGAGLQLRQSWGPEESIINYYPGTPEELVARQQQVARLTWQPFGRWLAWLPAFRRYAVTRAQRRHRLPGRLYSFVFERP